MRELMYAVAGLAGAAILTAIAVMVPPESPLWRWTLWGGIGVFAACACVLFVDYVRPGGSTFYLIALGAGLALAITSAIALMVDRPSDTTGNVSHRVPDIMFLPPVYKFMLEWRAPANNDITMFPIRSPEDNAPLSTAAPIFRIKNIGNVVARDVTIEWRILNDIKSVIQKSERLKKYKVRMTDRTIGLFVGNLDDEFIDHAVNTITTRGKVFKIGSGSGYVAGYAPAASSQIPYLAPEINNDKFQDAVMPFSICELLQFMLVASAPEESYRLIIPIYVSIKWTSNTDQATRYRIDARSIGNISDTAPAGTELSPPAEVRSLIDFEVSRLDDVQ